MNPLLNLLVRNKGKGLFKAEEKDDITTIYIYDLIVSDDYWGGISALAFAKQLAAIDSPEIHLRINSPGGDVFAARSMVQAIKEHPSKIIAHIDGYAASAATFLVVAADESMISEGGMFMIHKAWTFAAGNSNGFLEMASLLDRTDQTLVKDYSAKTGKTDDEIIAWMDAETYFFGEEAVEAGFVDKIAEDVVKNQINWDLSAYDHAPESKNSDNQPEPTPKPEKKPDPETTNIDHLRRKFALIEKAA